jgi:hypothetical protein
VVCVWWDTCTVYWHCIRVFGLPKSRSSREDKMDRFVTPTSSDLTPADLNWWEILQSIVCLTGVMRWAFNTSLDFCTVLGVLVFRVRYGLDWQLCKYCVSMQTIMLKYVKWMHFYTKLLAPFHFPVHPILCNAVNVTKCVNGIFWLDAINKQDT